MNINEQAAADAIRTPISCFGEDDFVFVDRMLTPFFVRNIANYGEPEIYWLYYWHEGQKSWVTLRKITEAEREAFRGRSFSREQAEMYFVR